jgi:Putative methyltransferase.
MALAKSADVLIAADVVYDRSVLPALASCVSKFLSESQNRQAIFATTYRNENTFNLFEAKLKNEGIKVSYVPKNHIEDMTHIFPCYFDQPRTDVRICTMTK